MELRGVVCSSPLLDVPYVWYCYIVMKHHCLSIVTIFSNHLLIGLIKSQASYSQTEYDRRYIQHRQELWEKKSGMGISQPNMEEETGTCTEERRLMNHMAECEQVNLSYTS